MDVKNKLFVTAKLLETSQHLIVSSQVYSHELPDPHHSSLQTQSFGIPYSKYVASSCPVRRSPLLRQKNVLRTPSPGLVRHIGIPLPDVYPRLANKQKKTCTTQRGSLNPWVDQVVGKPAIA
jgi:hypothetical protein